MTAAPRRLDGLTVLNDGCRRPEGVATTADGSVWAGDAQGLVARIHDGDTVQRLGDGGVAPNGVAVDARGRILVADYGLGEGLKRLDPGTGAVERLVPTTPEGPVGRLNFVAVDGQGRLWCTDSTSATDDVGALRSASPDGRLLVVDDDGVQVVTDGLCFPNGLAFGPGFDRLYLAESGTRRVIVADTAGGTVGPFEPFGPALAGTPDGVAVDEEGWVWVTLVFEGAGVVAVDPTGRPQTVLDDPAGRMGDITNLAFGGPDLRDVYLACPTRDRILRGRSHVAGLRLPGFDAHVPRENR